MSDTKDDYNIKYSAQSIVKGTHRFDPSAEADVDILIENIDEVKDTDRDNTLYALESLRSYFDDGRGSNLSKQDAEIFAHYVKDKFSD